MYRWLLVFALVLIGAACESKPSRTHEWPDISFVVIDEVADKMVFERTKDFVPSLERVLVLPVMQNYQWEGRKHRFALADPIVVNPGEKTMRELFRALTTNNQSVLRCIVLARGYCPGTLQPVINYAGKLREKDVWLVELAKLPDAQFRAVAGSIAEELKPETLRVGGIKTFEDAVKDRTVLRTAELESPVVRSGGFRDAYVLWSMAEGTKVSICLSPQGRKLIMNELGF